MTNGDKIRQMTDEEITQFIYDNGFVTLCDIVCGIGEECKAGETLDRTAEQKCAEIISKWVKQEVEDGQTD